MYLLGSNFLNGTCFLFSSVNTEVNKTFNCLRMHFCFSRNGIPASWKSFPFSPSPYQWFFLHLWTHVLRAFIYPVHYFLIIHEKLLNIMKFPVLYNYSRFLLYGSLYLFSLSFFLRKKKSKLLSDFMLLEVDVKTPSSGAETDRLDIYIYS